MRPPPILSSPPEAIQEFPRAIWIPTEALPDCYSGTPVEMVREMSEQLKPGLSIDETIDTLIRMLADYRDLQIQIFDGPEHERAECFVAALLLSGVARPMAEG